MKEMTIGRLADRGGVGVETIRYYQRRGLLGIPQRTGGDRPGGGIRRYDNEDVRRLRFIRTAQKAGFSLEQIGELIELDAGEDRERARALARERIAALDDKIAELEAVRKSLQRLAQECAHTSVGPCPIIASFDQE